jgi:hypothetical protein
MPKKTRYQLPSTKKVLNGSSHQQKKPLGVAIQQSNIYRSINALPLHKFIDCIINQNLAAIIISGLPTQQELSIAWALILQQYSDAIGDNEHRLYANRTKQLAIETINYNLVIGLVDVLRKEYSKDLCNELNKILSTTFKFDYTNKENYEKDLSRCFNRAKGFKISIDLLQMQVNELEKKFQNKEGTKPTVEYYQSTLITLSDHAKYPINDNITVFEFCERIKRFNNYCEQLKSNSKKK